MSSPVQELSLEALLQEQGWTDEDLNALRTNPKKAAFFLKVVKGTHKVVSKLLEVIDCDKIPKIPDDYQIHSHVRHGQVIWNTGFFFLSRDQAVGEATTSLFYRSCIHNHVFSVNACVLDFLLEDTSRIPESWGDHDGTKILFWGTQYKETGYEKKILIRGIELKDGEWQEFHSLYKND
ncbi:MAG: hypothetical protein COU07_00965 [Candidatus Harrisonbacteria bacterium CG10_big_fil_rev_8_21_14_0_10_40_38]|uniref:Uncharacterized protein n=1 Tax=Candidatus Harrisonbacteria bacterium CG10_big_fil_rev_8_21_14_0_10_40_38 TaxID=1974583 RepID=A0A2H0UUY0_9BACT|nr:MAG: hypothetical protein COU07_00965 [Candidatus Harrisonbacteria bacterium CG10_big_fil_rev_8_21_14_0_10_40_38]